jgi:hypothetical protein
VFIKKTSSFSLLMYHRIWRFSNHLHMGKLSAKHWLDDVVIGIFCWGSIEIQA